MEECLARHVLAMPLAARRKWLFGIANAWGELKGGYQQRHGDAATERLKGIMMEIWNAGRSTNDNRQ